MENYLAMFCRWLMWWFFHNVFNRFSTEFSTTKGGRGCGPRPPVFLGLGWVVGGMVWGVAGVGPRRQGAGAMGRPLGGVGGRGRPQAVVGSVLQVLQRHQAQDAPQVMRTWGAHLEQQL